MFLLRTRKSTSSLQGQLQLRFQDQKCEISRTYPFTFFRMALITSFTPLFICFRFAAFFASFRTCKSQKFYSCCMHASQELLDLSHFGVCIWVALEKFDLLWKLFICQRPCNYRQVQFLRNRSLFCFYTLLKFGFFFLLCRFFLLSLFSHLNASRTKAQNIVFDKAQYLSLINVEITIMKI